MEARALAALLATLRSILYPSITLTAVAVRRDDQEVVVVIDDGAGSLYFSVEPRRLQGVKTWEVADYRSDTVWAHMSVSRLVAIQAFAAAIRKRHPSSTVRMIP